MDPCEPGSSAKSEAPSQVEAAKPAVDVAKLNLDWTTVRSPIDGRIGRRLVEECVRFARQAGYREITLWTHSILTAARRIYAAAGFKIVETETHDEFGPELMGETWALKL